MKGKLMLNLLFLFSMSLFVVSCTTTLDKAYNQGGPGAGRVITADSGPVMWEFGVGPM